VLSVVFAAVGLWDIVHVLFALVFCFIGALFISLGIFGLYLGRIYDEVKGRPIYIIDEKINF